MQEPSDQVEVTQKRIRCRHIHAAGHQCGSPALRHENFCYYHHTTRRPAPAPGKHRFIDKTEPFLLPIIEDRVSALAVASRLLSRLASNDLDIDRAAKMLYNLQLITALLPPEPDPAKSSAAAIAQPTHNPELVEELVSDETHGAIAPITEFIEPGAPSSRSPIAQGGVIGRSPTPSSTDPHDPHDPHDHRGSHAANDLQTAESAPHPADQSPTARTLQPALL